MVLKKKKDFCFRVKGNCRANRYGWVFLLSLDPHQSCKRYNWGDKMHQDLKQYVMMRVMMEHIYSLELNSGEFWSFILLQKGGIVLICSVYHRTRDTTERTKCCIWWWNPIPYFKGSFSGLIASFSWQQSPFWIMFGKMKSYFSGISETSWIHLFIIPTTSFPQSCFFLAFSPFLASVAAFVGVGSRLVGFDPNWHWQRGR